MSFVLECVLVDFECIFQNETKFFFLFFILTLGYMGLGVEMSAALYSNLDPGERKNFFRIQDLMNR